MFFFCFCFAVDLALRLGRAIPDLICFMSPLYSTWPRPRYAVKHIALSFLPFTPSYSLFFFFPFFTHLRETSGSMEQFQNHLWDCVMWCKQRMLIGLSTGPPSLHSGVSEALPVRLPLTVMGLDVIPTLAPMCWDVVGKLIADILGLWCQRFFISRFSLLTAARLKQSLLETPCVSSALSTLVYCASSSIIFHYNTRALMAPLNYVCKRVRVGEGRFF